MLEETTRLWLELMFSLEILRKELKLSQIPGVQRLVVLTTTILRFLENEHLDV